MIGKDRGVKTFPPAHFRLADLPGSPKIPFAPRKTGAGRFEEIMRLLDRYIARQVFVSAMFSVAVIIIILVLGNVFKEILRELAKRPDVNLFFVLKFILLFIPISLSLAIPFSFLVSILLVFGRLSADSEFIAMRMAGLSMARICVPIGVIAVFFTAICALVNVSVTPWAKTQMEGMKASLFNQVKLEPMMIFPDQQVMDDLPDHLVFTRKEDGILKGLQLVKMDNYAPQAILVAREAKVSVDLDSENPKMLMEMSDVNIMTRGDDGDFMVSTQPVYMATAPFPVSLDQFKVQNDKRVTRPDNAQLGTLIERLRDPGLTDEIRAANRIEIHKRFAFSMSCLAFALIGVPLGITAQRRESSAGFILGMIIAVTYYSLLEVAKGAHDYQPHILVWIPNVIFLALGLHLFRKLSRK